MWAVASIPVLVALALSDARGNSVTSPGPVVVTAQLALLAAAVGFACHHHRTQSARSGWTSAALTVAPVAVGTVAVAAAVDERGLSEGGAVTLCVGVTGVTLVWLATPDVARATAPRHPVTTGFVAGVLAAVATVGVSVVTPGSARPAPPAALALVATCVVVLGVLGVVAARSIGHHDDLPPITRALLVGGGALSATATASSLLLHPTGSAQVVTGLVQVAGWTAIITVAARILAVLADLRAADHQRVEQRVRFREQDLRRVQTTLHEARSAVAGIVSAHRIISSDHLLAPESRRRLESMSDAEIARLARLLTADRPGDRTGDLEDTLETAVESLRARGHEVELVTSHPHHHREPDEVACIVHALLDNAASHGRGPIEIAVEDRVEGVLISVTDHGPGVPRELRDRIFDWGASGTGSSGIGLYDAHSRARSLGGLLRLDDRVPGSTRFELELPVDGRLTA